MANRYAVATGNWSNPAIWDGGTLPAAGDVVTANGFTVTINQDIDVKEIRTRVLAPAAAGGGFSVSSNRTIIADILAGTTRCLNITGSVVVNIFGNVEGSNAGASSTPCIEVASASTCNLTGNVLGGNGSGGNGTPGVQNAGTLYVIGNVQGNTSSGWGILNTVNGIVIVDGNIIGGSSVDAFGYRTTSLTASLAGNCIAIGSSVANTPALQIAAGNVDTKIVSAVYTATASPVSGPVQFTTTTPTITILLAAGGTITLTNPAQTNPPSEANVRLGTVFGGGAYVGSLIVPNPNNVRLGIPTDNTVGTGIVTGEDFFNTIRISSDPLAERLRNVATVKVVGDQFNSFNAK